MAIEKINIDKFIELAATYPVIDVRSPGEYTHAHIPGAVSIPLFSDEERKVVGTAYKQESREQAIKIGLDFFGGKMAKMLGEVEETVGRRESGGGRLEAGVGRKIVLVYCWRGGMRSAGVAWLLDLYGFKVSTLQGGYKSFRNYVLDLFRHPFRFHILGGYTGSGKTELLKALRQNGQAIVDLEAIARHKGSAFGNIGMPPQPTQEMFENLLGISLSAFRNPASGQEEPAVWLEDESQRIGQVNIPHELWKTMRNSPVWFLDIPFPERLRHLVEEYGALDPEKLENAITRISQKLGGLNAKTAILCLKEGKIAESFSILLQYYDKHYFKSLHNRENVNSLLQVVTCSSVTPENASQLILESQSISRSSMP